MKAGSVATNSSMPKARSPSPAKHVAEADRFVGIARGECGQQRARPGLVRMRACGPGARRAGRVSRHRRRLRRRRAAAAACRCAGRRGRRPRSRQPCQSKCSPTLRDAAELRDRHAGGGVVVVLVLERQRAAAEQFAQVVDGQAAVDQQRAIVAVDHQRRSASPLPLVWVRPMHRFHHVVDGDQAGDVAVFVDHHRQRLLFLAQDLQQLQRVASIRTRTAPRAGRGTGPARAGRGGRAATSPRARRAPRRRCRDRPDSARTASRASSRGFPRSFPMRPARRCGCAASSGFRRCDRPGASPGASCCVRRRRSRPARGFRSPAGGSPLR